MPSKTVREMNAFMRRHYSLGLSTFRSILLLSLLISSAAVLFGFSLYIGATRHEYRALAGHISRTACYVVDTEEVMAYAGKVIDLYSPAAVDRAADQDSGAYRAVFTGIEDEGFAKIRALLHGIEKENEAVSIYVGAIDTANRRLVYVIDSDHTADYCRPGSFEMLRQQEIRIYCGEQAPELFQGVFGSRLKVPAVISNYSEYGYLCTAAKELGEYGGMKVFMFTDLSMEHLVQMSRRFLVQYFLILAVITMAAAFLGVRYLNGKVVQPVNMLADAALAYSRDRDRQESGKKYFTPCVIRTGNELENLGLILEDMESDIDRYVKELTTSAADRERIVTELGVAERIQTGVVPHGYPAFPDRTEFDVYASMRPAREVGGDFYDYFLTDEDHLVLVIADVSGKGIPGALFMMAAKIMILDLAMSGEQSPAGILRTVNERVCWKNPAEMFVTVWLGILDIPSGRLTCCNAGHEFPAVRRAGGRYELFRDTHCFVVGGMEGTRYRDYELDLMPGDSLYLYTDGVTEAHDKAGALFGTERMIGALNTDPGAGAEELLAGMDRELEKFSQDAEQFDDITQMYFKYCGCEKQGEEA